MVKTQLTFLLSAQQILAAEISENQCTLVASSIFERKKEEDYRSEIQQFIQDNKFKDKEYTEYSLSWFNPNASLIPMNVFGTSSPKAIYEASFTVKAADNDIDFNRISELSLVNVYEIPLWVKSAFVIPFPRIVIQHEVSHLIRGIFEKSSFKLAFHLHLIDSYLQLVVVKHNELKFYNCFEITGIDDVFYYLFFSIQQLELQAEEKLISIYSNSPQNDIIRAELIQQLQSQNNAGLTSARFKWQDAPIQTLKFQTSCV